MKSLLLGTLVLSISAVTAQGQTGSAKTSGSCSPALNGNNNVVTISCTGLSLKKANDLLKVMNQILARQLDLKQVNDQLTQIHSDVENLNSSLNPLDYATPAESEFLQQITRVIVDCFGLSNQWGQLANSTHDSQTRDGINVQEATVYQTAFLPKALIWRDRMLTQLPEETGFRANYNNVHDLGQLGGVCMDLNTLGLAYKAKITEESKRRRTSATK